MSDNRTRYRAIRTGVMQIYPKQLRSKGKQQCTEKAKLTTGNLLLPEAHMQGFVSLKATVTAPASQERRFNVATKPAFSHSLTVLGSILLLLLLTLFRRKPRHPSLIWPSISTRA